MKQKITADQLNQKIAKGEIAPLYYLSSDELLLRNEAIDELRQACRNSGFNERTSVVLDTNSNWEPVWECLSNISLFGEKKILEITIPTGKPGRNGSTQLIKIAQTIAEGNTSDTVIILSLPKLETTVAKAKWVQALLEVSTEITIPTIRSEQLPNWIAKRLLEQQQTCDNDTLQWIADQVEGNLFAANQEILKLGLIYPPGIVTWEQAQQAILDVTRYNVFDISHAIYDADGARAIKVLRGLRAEGEALPMILGLISREIRILYNLAIARQRGIPLSEAMRQQRVFNSRQAATQQLLQKLSLNSIMGLIQHAHDIDRTFKGYPVQGRLTDCWEELNKLILKMVQA